MTDTCVNELLQALNANEDVKAYFPSAPYIDGNIIGALKHTKEEDDSISERLVVLLKL